MITVYACSAVESELPHFHPILDRSANPGKFTDSDSSFFILPPSLSSNNNHPHFQCWSRYHEGSGTPFLAITIMQRLYTTTG